MPERSLYAPSRAVLIALTVAVLLPRAAAAQPAGDPPCTACIAFVAAAGQAVLVDAPLNGVEILVRVGGDGTGVAAAVGIVREAGGRPGLWVTGAGEPASYAALLPAITSLVFDLSSERGAAQELAFRLKSRSVEARGASPGLRVGVAGRPDLLEGEMGRDLAPYIDFVANRAATGPRFPPSAGGAAATFTVRPPIGGDAADRPGWILELPADALAARALLRDVATTAPLLPSTLVAGGMADVRCGPVRLPTFLDPETLDTLAIVPGCPEAGIQVSPDQPGGARVALSTGEIVIRVHASDGRFAEGVEVVGARALGVREIVARHQAAAARQRRAVRRTISTGTMTLTFEAPGFPAPLTISSRAVIYTGRDRTEIEQRDIRVNGVSFQSEGSIPRLPLIEPERVAAPPLAITLSEIYRYELAGQERVGGVPAYVVSFEPAGASGPAFAGRAWIAMDSFAMLKVSAVQTGLRGPITSSEQTDEFERHGDAWLLARSEIRQIYEGPGHRTPIHRVLRLTAHDVNPEDFEARRLAAYASPSVMLRDTPEGFRYLQRERGAEGVAAPEPTVAGPATEVRTIALGVILDPNISRPLPFAGLSYVDFDLFGTGTQFNGFFGGSYGQLAVSVPSVAGTRWQLAGRAFGIASSYNDRAFENGREIYERNISQRPAHASVWVVRPLTARLTARAGYDFDYTHFGRADSTGARFLVPASQAAHGLRLSLDGQRAGWAGSLWWSGVRRAGWRPWGDGAASAGTAAYQPDHRDFQRMGAVLSRSFVASPRLVGRVEAAWMTGTDLDRFSRYTFGSFDNRLRGYPSALIRYDRGGVLRSAVAWAAGRLLRLDGFLDSAYVRDPGFGAGFRSYTGAGAAAEVPAPFGTLVAVEWGYGFQGINSDGRRGTQVVRITGYKMF